MKSINCHIRITAIMIALAIALHMGALGLVCYEVYASDNTSNASKQIGDEGHSQEKQTGDSDPDYETGMEPDDDAGDIVPDYADNDEDIADDDSDNDDGSLASDPDGNDTLNDSSRESDGATEETGNIEDKAKLEKLRNAEGNNRDVVPTGIFTNNTPALLLAILALIIAVSFAAITRRRQE